MGDQDSLLADVKRNIVTWGGDLRRSYGDGHGQYAIRFRFRGETYIGVAKQQPERGLASFMQKVTRRALDQDVLLVEFFGEDPTLGDAFVFQPITVLEAGTESQGASKKDVPTDWYELPLKHGVLLGDYVSGRRDAPEPPEQKEPSTSAGPVTLQDYA